MIVLNLVGMVRLPWKAQGTEKDRNFLRKLVVIILFEETAGSGGGDKASKYEYIVENTAVGDVFLTRPAYNYKGFDFVINLRNWTFSNGKSNPKHDDVISDIRLKMERMGVPEFLELKSAIEEVFKCGEPDHILERYPALNGYNPADGELPVDALLKILKWMFIEQDIRDWNYSGRNMLMNGIEEVIGL